MSTDTQALEALADRIAQAIIGATPHSPIAAGLESLEQGYELQDLVTQRLAAHDSRGAVTGFKVALGAPAQMERFGIHEPVSARIYSVQRLQSPADLGQRKFGQLAFEPEIAALIGQTLEPAARAHDRASVRAAVQRLMPAVEVLDQRRIDMGSATIADVVAQNISGGGIVIGGPGVSPEAFDDSNIKTVVKLDGKVAAEAENGAPQHPLDVVAWMANHLASRGLRLEAGMVVLCGTHTPIVQAGDASNLQVSISGLGDVELKWA